MFRLTPAAAIAVALTAFPATASANIATDGEAVSPRAKQAQERPRFERVAVPAVLQRIALCESGGNPGAVSSDGTYRGKYQFDRTTWAAMGGAGDPAAASEAEQDARAFALYRQAGTSPWPVCGGR